MNISILYTGRLGNQLMLLYHVYDTYSNVEKIYSPNFSEYKSFFNIKKLCSKTFYNKNKFKEVGWREIDGQNKTEKYNYGDEKFKDLQLKDKYKKQINKIVKQNFDGFDKVAVHIRHGDYDTFNHGNFYFSYEKYMEACFNKIKEWKLTNYKILVFSDVLQRKDSNAILAKELTNGISVIDLYLMAECNYFISTHSTFSRMAMNFSKQNGKFKNNYIMQK